MKILLLSVAPPTSEITSGIILDRIVRLRQSEDSFCAIYCQSPNSRLTQSRDLDIPDIRLLRPPDRAVRLFGTWVAWAIEWIKKVWVRWIIFPKALRFAKREQPDCIWVTLHGRTEVLLTKYLEKALGIPILTYVWDHPQWLKEGSGMDPRTYQRFLVEYASVIEESVCCATASGEMAKQYSERYKVPTVVFLNTLPDSAAAAPSTSLRNTTELVIAIAGQIYALKEWSALVGALKDNEWKVEGRDITIALFGNFIHLESFVPGHMNKMGYRTQAELISWLSKNADVLYGSYWLDERYRNVTTTSFPGKVITYLASGRPIMFHGPVDSQPARVILDHMAGIVCDSLDKNRIYESIRELVMDETLYRQCAHNGTKVFHELFTDRQLASESAKYFSYVKK